MEIHRCVESEGEYSCKSDIFSVDVSRKMTMKKRYRLRLKFDDNAVE